MVKVTFFPLQEIVVHEVIEHKIQDLVKLRVLGLKVGETAQPLLWAEGIVFSRNTIPPTEDVIRDQLKGIIHFSVVEWAPMPTYRNVLKLGGVTIPIIDARKNANLMEVARAVRHKNPKQ